MNAAHLERFFGSLNQRIEDAAAFAHEELARFRNELTPRLETARTLERELDRQLARKFNAFDYFRTNELGLSQVIADLLDPKAAHSQDDAFLRLLLDMLRFEVGGDLSKSKVEVEHTIKDGRRIDIAVHMGDDACLAIENKPYAGDQPNQVEDYLKWLKAEHTGGFLLIYLSPDGAPPSHESVKPAELKEDHAETFRIMPYHRVGGGAQEDGFEDFRTDFGLTDWLKECRKHCDVERLRWFLREAETFCERRFGGNAMTTGEFETVKGFVLQDKRNWETARAIQRALPEIDEKVREDFLESIAERIRKAVEGYEFITGSQYGDKPWQSWVWAYLPHWREHDNWKSHDGRVALMFQAGWRQGNNWLIKIGMPAPKPEMSVADRGRRERIEEKLTDASKRIERDNDWNPWHEYLDKYRDWDPLIPDIHAELQAGKGEITDYFVEKFVEVAKWAVPILNEIEGTQA